jgi:mRNA-degrading endonuclease RelE of RelBE toxin-antitoxin system
MSWQVSWTPRALKDARKLDSKTRARVAATIERLAETGSGDVRQLTDVRPPEWRLRVGSWRVRFRKNPSASTLEILRVLPRDKAY